VANRFEEVLIVAKWKALARFALVMRYVTLGGAGFSVGRQKYHARLEVIREQLVEARAKVEEGSMLLECMIGETT
jgi:hypothetical protein